MSAMTITYIIAMGSTRKLIHGKVIAAGNIAPIAMLAHRSAVNLSHFIARVSSHTATDDRKQIPAQYTKILSRNNIATPIIIPTPAEISLVPISNPSSGTTLRQTDGRGCCILRSQVPGVFL